MRAIGTETVVHAGHRCPEIVHELAPSRWAATAPVEKNRSSSPRPPTPAEIGSPTRFFIQARWYTRSRFAEDRPHRCLVENARRDLAAIIAE